MSSLSNSWMSEAWMAAPRDVMSDGLIAVDEVEGDKIVVVEGKMDWRSWEILGVCDVPPERIT
jgi:hypothetical protein